MNKTSVLIAAIISLALFFVIFALVASGYSKGFDSTTFLLINNGLNVNALNWFFVGLSLYGREYFWILVIALIWVLGKKDAKKGAILLVIALIFMAIIGTGIKDLYYQQRPFDVLSQTILLVPPDTDSAFPSGHALIVIGAAVMALLTLRKRYSIPLFAEALLVSYSRMYVGAHYPLDVLAGGLVGAAISLFVFYALSDSAITYILLDYINGVYSRIISTLKIRR
jgi:undecaprenyl-diphosphatase